MEITKSVKLLSIEIDNQLSFNQHISKLCSKPAMQLNLIYSDNHNHLFQFFLLPGIFAHVNLRKEIEKFQNFA